MTFWRRIRMALLFTLLMPISLLLLLLGELEPEAWAVSRHWFKSGAKGIRDYISA